MKKFLSLALTLVMVISMLVSIPMAASAEGTEITAADVIGTVPAAPVMGGVLPDVSNVFTVSAGANYAVNAYWMYSPIEYTDWQQASSGETVRAGYKYMLSIAVVPMDGYTFAADATATINGTALDSTWSEPDVDTVILLSRITTVDYPDFTDIPEVSITADMPEEIEAGDTLSPVTATVPEGALYTAAAEWIKFSDNSECIGETAAAGEIYMLKIRVIPNDGYSFSHFIDALPTVNGEERNDYQPTIDPVTGAAELWFFNYYSLCDHIDIVEVSFTAPAKGAAVSSAYTIPEDANYEVTTFDWCYYDHSLYTWVYYSTAGGNWGYDNGEGWTVVENSNKFGTKDYDLDIRIEPKDGYDFTEDTVVTANGDVFEDAYVTFNTISFTLDYDLSEVIEKVEISFTEPALGEAAAAPTVPANAGYTVSSEYDFWYNYTTGENIEIGDLFEPGGEYELYIDLDTLTGYKFTDETEVWLNGVLLDSDDYNINDGDLYFWLEETYDFTVAIDKVEITYDIPEIGKDVSEFKIPENVNYSINTDYTGWYDYDADSDEFFTGKYADGGRYDAAIELIAAPGYKFTDDTVVIVNGEETDNYGYGDYSMSVGAYHSFAEQITEVSVSLSDVEIGKAPLTEADITLGDKTKYEITYLYWGDEPTVIEDGNRYFLNFEVTPLKGYEFAKDVKVTINGEYFDVEYYNDATMIDVYVDYTFNDFIDAVELPAITEPKVGDDIPEYTVVEPEGKNYSYDIEWLVFNKDGYTEPASGKFEDGKTYKAYIYAYPNAGYEFSEDAVVTVGGKQISSLSLIKYYDMINVSKVASFGGLKLVDKIEITTTAPAIGSSPAKITVAEDAAYTLGYSSWGVSTDGTIENAEDKKGVWRAGETPLLIASVAVKEGYILSSDAEIYLNGKKVSADDVLIFADESTVVLHQYATLSNYNPPTGDSSLIIIAAVVCVLALAGICFTVYKRKKAN